MAKNVKNDDEGGGGTGNLPDGKKVLEFVERIENLEADLATEKSESMTRCKVIHTDIKQVFKDAKKEAGINKKGLKKVLDKRRLETKLKDLDSDEDAEALDSFHAYCAAIDKVAA